MIYLSEQPIEYYFKWQIEVFLNNFSRLGINANQIHVLLAYSEPVDIRFKQLIEDYSKYAKFYFYEDSRSRKSYLSSIRPHIIAKDFDYFPELENEYIFYHNANIIFRESPNFEELLINSDRSTCTMSDANSYIDVDFLNYFNTKILFDLCKIVKVNPENVYKIITALEVHSIFLEMLEVFLGRSMSGIVRTYRVLNKKLTNYKEAMIDVAEFGPDELDFYWPKQPINEWNKTKIFHNVGVNKEDTYQFFYKGFSPYNMNFNYITKHKCSIQYVEEIIDTVKNKRYKCDDFVIFFLVRMDSSDRLRNLEIIIDYLTKHFDVKIEIWEVDKNTIIPSYIYNRENIIYKFIECNESYLYRTKYFNQFAKATTHKYIGYLDCDCIFEKHNLAECVDAVSNGYTLAIPFDGDFVNIDNIESINQFARELKVNFLKDTVPSFIVAKSVGGGVIVNKDDFLEVGGENEDIIGWGTDDIDRVYNVLINGKKVFRSKGSIYHLDHLTVPITASEVQKNIVEQINNYIK